ncbi:uncharacterized protein LOC124620023 [Schistocerca americana]|uniref:uncharacterized protein LOC124620023 n=1 Tax=Schistocerca americana TaxID=7009 RepID=UPI001F5001C8|nr:uncharacterized protein LOC124620023 [Schistocerca americana]XP_049940936.1 uncharacterized protein LOC126417085 [Schistocerca serialis cubense]
MTGRMKQLGEELSKYQDLVTAIQEMILPEGVMKTGNTHMFFNSNERSQAWTSAVGFSVHNKMISAVNKWAPISDRICWMILNAKPSKISLVNCHAPSEDADEETKNDFYLELENVVDRLPRHSIHLIMGDFNAQVGREVQYRPTIAPD